MTLLDRIKQLRAVCEAASDDWEPEADPDGALFLGIIRVPDYEDSEYDVAFLTHARTGYMQALDTLAIAVGALEKQRDAHRNSLAHEGVHTTPEFWVAYHRGRAEEIEAALAAIRAKLENENAG